MIENFPNFLVVWRISGKLGAAWGGSGKLRFQSFSSLAAESLCGKCPFIRFSAEFRGNCWPIFVFSIYSASHRQASGWLTSKHGSLHRWSKVDIAGDQFSNIVPSYNRIAGLIFNTVHHNRYPQQTNTTTTTSTDSYWPILRHRYGHTRAKAHVPRVPPGGESNGMLPVEAKCFFLFDARDFWVTTKDQFVFVRTMLVIYWPYLKEKRKHKLRPTNVEMGGKKSADRAIKAVCPDSELASVSEFSCFLLIEPAEREARRICLVTIFDLY